MKPIALLSLAVVWVFSNTAWADRCVGPKDFEGIVTQYGIATYAQSDIVWCDDFDTYCTANDGVIPGGVWPGYPPSPDNLCATDAVASDSWFTNAVYHWPPDGYTGGSQMAMDNSDPIRGWDGNLGWPSMPFIAIQEGGGNTTQYHTFELAGAIGQKFSGSNAINGTDDEPLVLRWWAYAPGNGVYHTTPHYMELRFDDDRAPTDYIEWDCGFVHDCNCYWANTDATCDPGTCANLGTCTQGTCEAGVCDWDNGWVCILGPRLGQSCDNGGNPDDFMCYECNGGEFNGGDCQTYLDCGQNACNGGANDGQVCTTDSDCAGTCSTGPQTGQACNDDADCGSCLGGANPGGQCSTDHDCQTDCITGQTPSCDGGTHDGQTCTDDADCFGGPVFPIVNQIEYNYLLPSCPPSAPCTPSEGYWPSGPSNGYIVDPSPNPGLSTAIHASIAFGWFPHANEQGASPGLNPCDLANGRKPTNYHAQTFDGDRWRDLRSNKYLPGYGDFNFGGADSGQGFFQIAIKQTQYLLKLTASTVNQTQVVDNEATLTRIYTGPFNKISMGTGPGCKLAADGNCAIGSDVDVYRYPTYDYNRRNNVRWGDAYLDRPVLLGGVGNTSEGACCDTEGGCTVTTSTNCTAGTWQGVGTACDPNPCCPQVWADADRDGDVDQDDFAAFQLCFSGAGTTAPAECNCWDRDTSGAGDGDVDADDYSVFNTCWTGPNVPYNLGSLPTGCE